MSVGEYINQFDGEVKARLVQVRATVKAAAPEAEESIAYGMPAYKLHGKPLVYFGGYPGHIGFYATPVGHAAFEKKFAPYKKGKGSVQFPHDKPLPVSLIQEVVDFRVNKMK